MPKDGIDQRREAAEETVRHRFERERSTLIKQQREQQEQGLREHKRTLEHFDRRQSRLDEQRDKELERLDENWKRQRDMLALRMNSAPSFSLFGPPPRRAIEAEYLHRREQWSARRDEIERRNHEQTHSCQIERAECQQKYMVQNQLRDRRYLETRIDLADRQQKSFEHSVQKELNRPEQSISRAFSARTRPVSREVSR